MESPGAAPPAAPEPAPAPAPPPGKGKRKRGPRPHPYADEVSTARELKLSPTQVTLFWTGLATALAAGGLLLARRFSPFVGTAPALHWDLWTDVPLFAGLGLLGFGFVAKPWARRLTMAGWLLFASYWSLVAQDLFVQENGDYVNMAFALIGTYFFTYLAYHQWLNEVRQVENRTVRFLNISTFVAAGSYFVIDKLEPLRTWLIVTVSNQTAWMLGLFGQGPGKGLVYLIDTADQESPTNFFYTTHFCDPSHPIKVVADYCRSHDLTRHVTPTVSTDFWGPILHFNPTGEPAAIIPVTVILACTALQSIMLFVGLFMGTSAPLRKKLWASAAIAAVVYVLNLLRNTGIIWFYGQGVMSFWVIHDAIGKGGSLVAMVAIAFGCFAWFPEFLTALVGVLDLPHRDGPVERTLRIGRRRPEALPAAPAPHAPPPSPPAPPA
ncbi:MAG: archaeosortase [Thermoplasmata archaeon]|jgi:exosortase/archaeosortase family protein|nr:archaeosortase [Thermoplasmata archaeon]